MSESEGWLPTWRGWLVLVAALLVAIIVPFLMLEHWFETGGVAWLEAVRARPGAAAAAIIALLCADVVLPVPSSIVGVFAGSVLGLVRGAVVLWLGLMAGAVFGYWLGARPGRGIAARVVGGRQVAALQRRFTVVGPLVLVLARGVPVLAEASVIAAGAAGMNFAAFGLATGAANVVVAMVYAGVGAVAAGTGSLLLAFGGLVLVPALAWTLWILWSRRGA